MGQEQLFLSRFNLSKNGLFFTFPVNTFTLVIDSFVNFDIM